VDRDRRRICQAGLALGAASVLPACGNAAAPFVCNSANSVAVGNVADVALDGAVMHQTPDTRLFVCRDKDGYYAVDAGCTHLGCDVAAKNSVDIRQGFACPCHGATYDGNGLNPTAPAPSPLVHYYLCVQPSGTLLADLTPNLFADAKVRLKP
jgi:cytochrome b6-f complex iron-sulfur subunit